MTPQHSSPVTDRPWLLADRLRFLWQQPKLGLREAQEIIDCLPGIIAILDELPRHRIRTQQPASPENELEAVTQAIWQAHKDNLHLRMTDVYRVMGVAAVEAMRANAPKTDQTDPSRVSEFTQAILHGDDEHRGWLLEAASAFEAGKPIPPARSAVTRPVGKATDNAEGGA